MKFARAVCGLDPRASFYSSKIAECTVPGIDDWSWVQRQLLSVVSYDTREPNGSNVSAHVTDSRRTTIRDSSTSSRSSLSLPRPVSLRARRFNSVSRSHYRKR